MEDKSPLKQHMILQYVPSLLSATYQCFWGRLFSLLSLAQAVLLAAGCPGKEYSITCIKLFWKDQIWEGEQEDKITYIQ